MEIEPTLFGTDWMTNESRKADYGKLPLPKNCTGSGDSLIVVLCEFQGDSYLIADHFSNFLKSNNGEASGKGINNELRMNDSVEFFD